MEHVNKATGINAADISITRKMARPVNGSAGFNEVEVVKEEVVRRRDDSSGVPDRGSPPGMPRWVKVFGIIAGIVVLLVVGAMLIVGGEHGPGRHLHGNDTAAAHVTPSGVGG